MDSGADKMTREGEGMVGDSIIPHTNKCPKCPEGWLSSKDKGGIAWIPTCNWCGYEAKELRHHNRRKQQTGIWWADRRKSDE
jgi:hypothetical protein